MVSKGITKVRGIIAAPNITLSAKTMLEDWGFMYKQISPPKYTKEISDLKSALHYLRDLGYHEFALVGHSMGGAIATLTAAEEVNIKLVVPISAVAFPKTFTERHFDDTQRKELVDTGETFLRLEFDRGTFKIKVTKDFVEDMKQYSPTEVMSKITAPVFVIHGDEDKTIPVSNGQAIFDAANEPKRMEIIKCADHDLHEQEHKEKLVGFVIEGLKKWF